MRFSEAWLREWVDPEIDTDVLADQLSMAGLEVDAVESAAPVFSGVVVGHVLTREQHPNADKLSLCTVDVGSGDALSIVCGARNVAAGMKVPVATIGGVMPGDFKIKKAKLRGVESFGMICSASELGLAESSDGILALPTDAPPGTDLREYLQLDDACIEVDLTPDRGDCLSISGIAREVGVLNRAQVTKPAIEPVTPVIDDRFGVELVAENACPRYCCRIIRDIDPGAMTPDWMVEKLRRSGLRSISPVVDVTNFVLLELGQPMHAFDLDKLEGGIRVRLAGPNERLTLLDGNEIELQNDNLVIADHAKAVALAGIMGGEDSAVSDATRHILLESAFFAPLAISGKARSHGLHTDSSHRFERGVDHALQVTAMERATALLLDIVGGRPGPVVSATAEAELPRSPEIPLRRDRIRRILGVDIPDTEVAEILARLGMVVESTGEGWRVTPPTFRFDIAIEVDLIEEIGRIHGYANIPENLSHAPVSMASCPEAQFDLERARDCLVERGYQEVVTYSFIGDDLAAAISPDAGRIRLSNPISAELAIMRDSLWPGLLGTLTYNLARQQSRVRIFETGLRFRGEGDELDQAPCIAGLAFGHQLPEQWGAAGKSIDFYDLKGDLEAVLSQVADLEEFRFEPTDHPALHPGQAATVVRNGAPVGSIGMLHPEIQARLDVAGNVYLFEIELAQLMDGKAPTFEPLSKFPAIRRDLAVLVKEDISYGDVLACAKAAAPSQVRDIRLFDVYTGDNIDSGLKSLALSLILQDSSRTLTDQDVDRIQDRVVSTLVETFSVKLRDQ